MLMNKPLTVISLILLASSVYQQSYDIFLDHGLESIPPDASKTPTQLCKDYGYILDTNHTVTTEDGYLLNMWHLTKNGGTASNKPVLMQHGLLATGHCFMCNMKQLSPAFMLVDHGFDVWLSNTRGNFFSRNHKTLNPDKDMKFWDFTFTDMGRYDVPANLNYVLEFTGKKRMAYVGHSQGTMQMFYALSEIGDQLKDILMGFVALAPVARLGHVTSSLLHYLAEFRAEKLVEALGIHQFLPQFWLVSSTAEWVCADLAFLCQDLIWLLFDAIPLADNIEREAVSYAYYPAGTSLKDMVHFAQLVRSGQFQEYDYGSSENLKKYGQKTPPIIDLTKMSDVQIAIYSGGADELADPTDVKWLVSQINSDILKVNNEYEQMGHSTFNLGKAENMVFMESVYEFLDSLNWEDADQEIQ